MVVLAGCAGGFVGNGAAKTGTVQFYVSDEKNAIDQFEDLNVTVTKVAFRPADTGNETGNETANESGLVVRDINDTRVDLTELQGANATLVGNASVPAGNYTGVFVHVENASGTLKESGERVDVKVPSSKLHVNSQFEVGGGEEVEFVFDMTVVETGNGKYILKPVVSESGTDVPIEKVDGKAKDREGAGQQAGAESALNASFVGDVQQGENVTVEVTKHGEPVANATVTVDGERVGQTDADGTITIHVPSDADRVVVKVQTGDASTTLRHTFQKGGGQGGQSTSTTTTASG
ncbi:DUF4382 domain-containing protein [Halospeciosus flavus]|uniref:DUF4382 domain-containing protein n=2 Tax=Halospeciosus flavus TaxID=3032283 RepID=A0ABD5Z7G2_9EURY